MSRPLFPEADWPTDDSTVRLLVRSEPDAQGRQNLWALFWQNGQRAVLFHRDRIATHKRRAEAEGLSVEVVDQIPVEQKVAA